MHRSGTSLTARLLSDGGWHPGESLLVGGATRHDESERYEEDAAFVALHRAWLERHLPPGDGHHDWGVSDGGAIDLESLTAAEHRRLVTDARTFVEQRDDERERWVAKDPRATLFLPVWAEIASLEFVLVYRNPWDVVASAVRLGADVFCRRPRHALDAWLDHNRRLIAFATEHRNRCFVLASERVTADAGLIWATLAGAVGLDGPVPADLVDPTRYRHRDDGHAISMLYRDAHPEVCAVLDQLDDMADVPRRRAHPATRGVLPGGSLRPGTGIQVIIPCRDDGDFVLEAVASVDECARYARTRTSFEQVELTMIDDGSTDPETVRILEALRRSGLQVIRAPGVGLAAARNLALTFGSTRAVIPLDADNRLHQALIDSLDILEHDGADIVHGPWRRFGLDRAVVDPPSMTLDSLVPGNTIDACALISRDLLERVGGWDADLPFWEDWDLWLGAVRVGARAVRIDDVTFDYLVRPGALSEAPRRDPQARGRVVEHVVTKHCGLFGETMGRLVTQIHELDSAHRADRAAFEALEGTYRELEAHHLGVAAAHRNLEDAYRALESAYVELEASYRALEARFPGDIEPG